MAIIKTSNQITFTEVKKIKEIKEWYLATSHNTGVTDDHTIWNWTEEIQTINEDNQYLWNYEETIYSIGDPEKSEPIIIGFYGQGVDGKGIADIENYYLVTQTPELPEDANPDLNQSFLDNWFNSVPLLSSVNKYLWNCEIIIYTDGTTKITSPAIIGAYGDSDAEVVDFQIYSTDGFEFTDIITSIELKTIAYRGGEEIIDGVTYQWKYWNIESSLEDKYEDIPGATNSILIINNADTYAVSSLKCEMTYNNIVYHDYVTLTKQNVIYNADINFFNGSNIFDQTKSYIIAYVKLYKNNNLEDTISTNEYYEGTNIILNNGEISTDIVGEFEDNTLMYFICYQNNKYNIVLGKYFDGKWNIDQSDNKYIYKNNIDNESTSNVFIIQKNDVSKSLEVEVDICEILSDGTLNIITTVQTNVIDINDPIISSTEPMNATYGQLWLDTSTDPYVLKIYTKKIKEYNFTLGNEYSFELVPANDNPDMVKIIKYFDDINVDTGNVTFTRENSVNVSYNLHNTNNVADVILGNYFYISDENEVEVVADDEMLDDTKTYHYIPVDADIYCELDTQYSVKVDRIQDVHINTVYYGEWIYFSQQYGKTIYTSEPKSGYKEGDLWILADGESYGSYGPGSMLKAVIDPTTNDFIWIDAMSDITSIIKNVRESFTWDSKGIQIAKRVTDANGNTTAPFYVHIDSTRMGFHSVEYDNNNSVKNDVEVVHVGINSATIQNAILEGEHGTIVNNSATFNEETNFNKDINIQKISSNGSAAGFTWSIEANGSLSLVVMEGE